MAELQAEQLRHTLFTLLGAVMAVVSSVRTGAVKADCLRFLIRIDDAP